MRSHLLGLVLIAALSALSPAQAQSADQPDIVAAMTAATDRFAGQIVSAELVGGRQSERAQAVFEFRMLTVHGDILRIRVDAQSLDILDVDGRGLVAARKPVAR